MEQKNKSDFFPIEKYFLDLEKKAAKYWLKNDENV